MIKINRNISQTDLQQPDHHTKALTVGTRDDSMLAAKADSLYRKQLFCDDSLMDTKDGVNEAAAVNDYSRLQCGNLSGASWASDEFRVGLDQCLARLWIHDRSAAADQLSTLGKQYTISSPTVPDYAEARRRELSAIPGSEHLAKQYGLQVAQDGIPPVLRSGLRVTCALNSGYHRHDPGTHFHELCSGIYRGLGHESSSKKILFANSSTNAAKIIKALKKKHPINTRLLPKVLPESKTTIKPLTPGLVAIELGQKSLSADAQAQLILHGGRPSAYHVNKLFHASNAASVRRLESSDNTSVFLTFCEELKETIGALKTLPNGHALQAIARGASALLKGLETTLSAKINAPNFKHDSLVANAMNALTKVSRALPALTEDSTRFSAAYAVLLEEMHLLLAVTKPYEEADFKQAAAKMLKKRAPTLEKRAIKVSETFLFSSGMDAISAGMGIVKKLTGKRAAPISSSEPFHEYYEILSLGKCSGPSRAVFVGLNSSLPTKKNQGDARNEWNAERLLEMARQWLDYLQPSKKQPAVLLLDITIEKQTANKASDLNVVLEKLAPDIEAGRLKIVLCKSFQKYISLGSAKIMAGGVTYISNPKDASAHAVTASLREAEKDLGWMGNDESQLLTHFMAHAHHSELEMIGQAAKNASFLRDICLAEMLHSQTVNLCHEEGLPFVYIEPVATHNFEGAEDENAALQQNLLSFATKKPNRCLPHDPILRQVAIRDSFAFLSCSFSAIGNRYGMRLSAGLESREELVEKLFAYSWVRGTKLNTLTPAEFSQQARQIAAQAMEYVLGHGDVTKWAPAALQVLRERAIDQATIRECEDLLNGKVSKAELQEKIETALMTSVPEPSRLLSQQLRIVGSAFAPSLDETALRDSNVHAMRAALHSQSNAAEVTSSAEMQARFACNAVASLLEMAGQGFGPEQVTDRFRPELESLYQAFFDSGLPRVSPATREHLLCDWSRLQTATLEKTNDARALDLEIKKWLRYAQLCPYRETRAKMFFSFPDQAFACLKPSLQRQLVDAFFLPLDAVSGVEFIKALTMNNNFAKLGSCQTALGKS